MKIFNHEGSLRVTKEKQRKLLYTSPALAAGESVVTLNGNKS